MNEGIIALAIASLTALGTLYQTFVKDKDQSNDNFREDFRTIVAELRDENQKLKERIEAVVSQNEQLIKQNRELSRKLNSAISILRTLKVDTEHLEVGK